MLARDLATVVIGIGGISIQFSCNDPMFAGSIQQRYSGYTVSNKPANFNFEIDLLPEGTPARDEAVEVTWNADQWLIKRGDFRAEFNPTTRQGRIQQTANPYSLDSVIRIVHTLLLADSGGFLLHASSAIRNEKAFLFSGVSGAGKTTIAKLAPPDAALLTDEISYVIQSAGKYSAVGTPFFGELGRAGQNLRAPIEAVYLLAKGPVNKIETLTGPEAITSLLENILFFARDAKSVKLVFDAACDFAERVPIRRLTFVPDSRVWELIV
jgi:hypothetical protein